MSLEVTDVPPVSATTGRVLVERVAVGAAVVVLAVVIMAFPLVWLGGWTPLAGFFTVGAAVLLASWVMRRLPPTGAYSPTGQSAVQARWVSVALVFISAGVGVWAGVTHAEHVVVRRDAGTYAQYGHHLATAHRASVDVRFVDLGSAVDPTVLNQERVTVGSPGFYATGSGNNQYVQPQFMVGTAVWLSIGWWLGSWTGLLLVPAVAMGFGVLAFGVLARRLLGDGAAVLAAAVLGVSYPVLHVGRATYSEPFALLLGCVAGVLLVNALAGRSVEAEIGPPPDPRRLTSILAGVILAGAGVIRIDAIREVIVLVPVLALLAIRRHRAVRGVVVGLLIGLGVTAVVAGVLSWRYLGSIAGSLTPLVGGGVLLAALSGAVVWLSRRGVALPGTLQRRLPILLALGVGALLLVLASRPWWLIVRQDPDSGARVVADLQQRQGLTVDGGRTYAEHAVNWISWWVGWPILLAAGVAAVCLAYQGGRWWLSNNPPPAWLMPAFMGLCSTMLTLYRPGITPDHPWADRRLVPVVLPTIVMLGVAAFRACWSARLGGQPVRGAMVMTSSVALLAPTVLATQPLASVRTERGQVETMQQVCRSFEPGDTAILVDSRAANEWTQVVRGVCGVPTVVVRPVSGTEPVDADIVANLTRAITMSGRRPVLAAAESETVLRLLGGQARLAGEVQTVEDQRLLTRRPHGTQALSTALWVAPVTASTQVRSSSP
ncbi:MAG: hypothetical protein ACRCTR_06595 [Actinomycetota bacterium]